VKQQALKKFVKFGQIFHNIEELMLILQLMIPKKFGIVKELV